VPVDERPRRVVVDREEDDVALADDESDVVGTYVLGDRLGRQTPERNTRVNASASFLPQAFIGEELPRPFLGLVAESPRDPVRFAPSRSGTARLPSG